MGSRAHIGKIHPDGQVEYVYLGHGCYPDDAGIILLENYREEEQADALIRGGSIVNLGPDEKRTGRYHLTHWDDWEDSAPVVMQGGSEAFFGTLNIPGPEWLYAWTPDGWLTAPADCHPPDGWWKNLAVMSPQEYQDWFDHNQQPEWVEWRERAREKQRPRPLIHVITQYVREKAKRKLRKEKTQTALDVIGW